MLLLPGTLDAQPQEAVEVDWGNPITAGLSFAQVGDNPANLAGPPSVVVGSLGRETGRTGRGLSFPGSTSSYLWAPAQRSAGGGTALAFCFLPNAASASNVSLVGVYSVSGSAVGGGVAHYLATSSSTGEFAAISTDANNFAVASALIPAYNRDHCVIGTFVQGGSRTLWVNGRKAATNATGRSPTNLQRVQVGVYSTDNSLLFSPLVGAMYLSCWWDRVLTDAEVQAISANPWQLFRRPAITYVPVAAAPGAALAGTITVAASTTGALTVPKPLAGGLSAVVTATGALTVPKPLGGAIAAVVTTTGALTVPKPLAGAIAAAVTINGGLAGSGAALAGGVVVASTVNGTLTVSKPLAGALAATVTAAGTLTVPKPLAGGVVITVLTAGALTGGTTTAGPGLIRATLTWVARVRGDVTHRTRLNGDITYRSKD